MIPAVIDGAPRTMQPLMSTAAARDIAHTHANSGGETARATEAQVADGFLRIERLTLGGLCQRQAISSPRALTAPSTRLRYE